ncbi:microfibril-associated glycoprotein 4-like [Culex pipiens pallens]|uniref:microfibril-associated glycoprotein 4-like n=1 Tax=Culex pipiens pallens TaxID=42434 RepID=UPI001954206D|nr:microfibril-associated glycoprotein 4-like [Culex pipiens pallens]
MYKVVWLLLCSGICKSLSTNNTNDGFGNEILLAKMNFLENKLKELQVELKEQSETILHKLESNKRVLIEQNSEIKQSIFELRPSRHPSDNSNILDFLIGNTTSQIRSTIASCKSSTKSGIYLMAVDQANKFEVYCEQKLYAGGWVVIQNRFNGSVDFYRNWTEYKNGFGDLNGEFWLGLDKIHALTQTKVRELLIHVEDFAGNVYYSKYGGFAIGSEDELFDLKTSLFFHQSGTMGDSLTQHRGHKFTTYDSDNDTYGPGNCAELYHGAWWYNRCHNSNLNGLYKDAENPETMSWRAFDSNYQGLSASKMMIK